jgi:hypothetical protein
MEPQYGWNSSRNAASGLSEEEKVHLVHGRQRLYVRGCRHCVHLRLRGKPGYLEDGPGIFSVQTRAGEPVLETDDWVTAQYFCLGKLKRPHADLTVKGTHPSHEWVPGDGGDPRGCARCGARDNGSYRSQGPCGYSWGRSLYGEIEYLVAMAAKAAEEYLRATAETKGTTIAAMGNPRVDSGGVLIDATTGDGREWQAWAGWGENPPTQVTWGDEDDREAAP